MLHGIMSDGHVDTEEMMFLKNWLSENNHLETVYPCDEIYSVLYQVMQDGKVDEEEEKFLEVFFSDFIDTG